jgi:cytochrome b subunit of formate dehydrogenase
MGEDKGWDEVLEEIGDRLNEEVEARFLRHSVVAWELLMGDWGDIEIDRVISLIQKQVGEYSGSILIMYMFARLWEKGTITAVTSELHGSPEARRHCHQWRVPLRGRSSKDRR